MALPLKEIPGSYGLPLIGPAADRAEFNGPAGQESYVRKRVDKYNSTVFRANMPPGPPGFPDSSAIFLADQSSYQVLFDMEQVEKSALFGSFRPSADFNGGYTIMSYLDPITDKEKHFKLKSYCLRILSNNAQKWLPQFETAFNEAFPGWEENMEKFGTAMFNAGFTLHCLTRVVLNNASMGDGGPTTVKLWVAALIAPLTSALVVAPVPFITVAAEYKIITDFFRSNGTEVLDMAQNEFGISDREEALHNLIFFYCFNAYGAMEVMLPSMLRYIGDAGEYLHQKLREEIRAAVKAAGGKVTMGALENAPLLKSTVYEVLRMDPPVKNQSARARKDLIISSHTARFKVKKGELLVGYQPFATKDPVVFQKPEEFMPERFMGSEGEKLLQYVLWSNGHETEDPTPQDKQCGGKVLPPLFSRLFIAHMFLHYDSFAIESYGLGKGQELLHRFTKLVKATS